VCNISDLQTKPLAKLVAYTAEADKVAINAACLCYNSVPNSGVLKFCKDSGHESVFEHNAFTFEIQTSRIISQMFTRHRIASFSQRSQRYVVEDAFSYITPIEVEQNPAFANTWKEFQEEVQSFYTAMVAFGIPAEQARFALTNATTTVFYMTANAREWRHFLRLRLCYRAQEDIRIIARIILGELMRVCPTLFDDITYPCLMDGFCSQGKMRCGKIKFPGTSRLMPTKGEVKGIIALYMQEVTTWGE